MQHEMKNKKLSIAFWILSVICMAVIFYFSSRTAEESSNQSGGVLSLLIKLFGENFFTVFIVRKSAHCLEFAGLCFLFNYALLFSKGKKSLVYAFALTAAYAISDELHQIFVEGRSCEFRDWIIDCAGALIGIAAFLVIFKITEYINLMRKNK